MTKDNFKGLFDNVNYNYFTYDSSKLEQVRSFATSNNIEIMVINIASFNRSFKDPEKEDKANVIHRYNDRLSGYRPIDFISQARPILIIDEPQSVDTTEKSKEALSSLNPLFTLRYSATHREKENLMYKLDSVDAYEKKLQFIYVPHLFRLTILHAPRLLARFLIILLNLLQRTN